MSTEPNRKTSYRYFSSSFKSQAIINQQSVTAFMVQLQEGQESHKELET